MKRHDTGRCIFSMGAIAMLIVGVSQASAIAAEVFRYDYQGAAGVCQPALSSYEPGLRSRPLSLANIGDSDVYVTCTFHGDATIGGRGAWQILVNVANESAEIRTVSCTLVDGFQSGASPDATYTTKSVGMFPGGIGSFIAWVPSEIQGNPAKINRPALSCLLPGKTTLHYIGINYNENIGN